MGCTTSVPDESAWLAQFIPPPGSDSPAGAARVNEELVDFAGLVSDASTIHSPSRRNVVSWLPPSAAATPPAGIVVLLHGLHEHCFRHHELASLLATSGNMCVYGVDHFGHGRSEGLRGMIYDWNKTIAEVVAFVEHVRAKHPDASVPLFIFAHSCGALFTTLTIPRLSAAATPRAVVLSATALIAGPDSGSPFGFKCLFPLTELKSFESLVGLLAAVAPTGDGAPIIREGLMHDEAERALHKADPRIYPGCIRTKTAYELVKMQNQVLTTALPAFPKTGTSVAFHHGADDMLIFPVGSERLYEACPAAAKSLRIHAAAKHEFLREAPAVKDPILAEIRDYFVAAAAAFAAGEPAETGTAAAASASASASSDVVVVVASD